MYKLTELEPGTYVYALTEMESADDDGYQLPPHWVCAACYPKRRSVLRKIDDAWVCQPPGKCAAPIHTSQYPQYAE
ncbi:hypothetical protein [Candidatus Palauibacter sp.]|uniref:hypothetical protein n=1 Tax=Candidatus Palauibacter sp. TaxID=3101350 RepID=UPI003B58E522